MVGSLCFPDFHVVLERIWARTRSKNNYQMVAAYWPTMRRFVGSKIRNEHVTFLENHLTPARDPKQVFVGIWEKASGRKHLGGDIWEETFQEALRGSYLEGDI